MRRGVLAPSAMAIASVRIFIIDYLLLFFNPPFAG